MQFKEPLTEISHCQIKLTFSDIILEILKNNLRDHLCISALTTIIIYRRKQGEYSLVCHFSLLSWRYVTLVPASHLNLLAK